MKLLKKIVKISCGIFFIFVVAYICFWVVAFNGFVIQLQNGYKLGVANAHSVDLYYENNSGVMEDSKTLVITRLNTSGNLIFGARDHENTLRKEDYKLGKEPSYFIVNTSDNKVLIFSNKQDWSKELQALGIKDDPKLLRPSYFFRWLRGR